MEKSVPHCKLAVVKTLVEDGKVRTTHAARVGATALGLELFDMLAVVMALTPADFYKSMTTPCRSHGMAGRVPPPQPGG